MSGDHWKHVWECSKVLELGAGATGIPSIVALKCGAKHAVITDHPNNIKALELLSENCRSNDLSSSSYAVLGLDWASLESVSERLDSVVKLDYIFAADVFYDPSVFELVIAALSQIFCRFPNALCIFTYEERDCDWTIEDLLILNDLRCSRVRIVDTNLHTIHIGTIFTNKAFAMSSALFAGIEGGATHSKLIIVDEAGKKYGEWSNTGTNYYLEGHEKVADLVATWIREVKKELNIAGPLAALGIGTSGAEDETINDRLCALLKQEHGDVACDYFVGTDSVVTIAATFEKGGVILIAGTGSSCRLLNADGTIRGVGGWGHMFSDGGSGFWISIRMIRYIFDDEDGLNKAPASTEFAKKLLLKHFNLPNIIGMLDLLYFKFEKAYVASFAGVLAKEGRDDLLVSIVFREAGESLGQHLVAISRHFDEAMFESVPVVAVGSVFESWDLLREGFMNAITSQTNKIRRIELHRLDETPALGAAVMAAKKINRTIQRKPNSAVFDVLNL